MAISKAMLDTARGDFTGAKNETLKSVAQLGTGVLNTISYLGRGSAGLVGAGASGAGEQIFKTKKRTAAVMALLALGTYDYQKTGNVFDVPSLQEFGSDIASLAGFAYEKVSPWGTYDGNTNTYQQAKGSVDTPPLHENYGGVTYPVKKNAYHTAKLNGLRFQTGANVSEVLEGCLKVRAGENIRYNFSDPLTLTVESCSIEK